MPALVAINYLGRPEQEQRLYARLEEFFKEYPGEWQVNNTGAQQNTVWELKVTTPGGRSEWVHKLYGEDGSHDIDAILTEVRRIAQGLLIAQASELSATGAP